MDYKKYNIELSDINIIKSIYRNGKENSGDSKDNQFDKRIDKETYRIDLVNAETFFCDLYNTELMDIIKKYIKLDNTEYITNVHYINYGIGKEAKPHVDTGSSIRTYIIMLSDNFEGGDFYLDNQLIPINLGEMIEFNADMVHSVSKVTNGNREVLVAWVKKSNKNKISLL